MKHIYSMAKFLFVRFFKLSFRQKATLILLVLYWLTLFVLAHISIPQFVRQAGVSDKTLHFLAYLVLVFLLWFTVSPDRKVSWRKATVWLVLLAAIGYGIADEWLQGRTGRSCDIGDFSADLAAVITGLILFSFFTFWPAALLVTGATIFGLTNVTRANLDAVLPMTNIMLHLFGYAIFTILWLQLIHLYLTQKPPKLYRLTITLSMPIGFLLAVKFFSAVLGRSVRPADVILAVAGIVAVVSAAYLITFFRRRLTGGFPPDNG